MKLIIGTVEWNALSFIKLDNSGYLKDIKRSGKPRLSRNARLLAEVQCFRKLLGENLARYEKGEKVVRERDEESYFYTLIREAEEAAKIRLPD